MENVDTAVYFPFSIFNLSTTTVVIDSLKLTFPCDATVFVGVSLTGSKKKKNDRDYSVRSLAFSKTAGYCLDDCFASCQNIVWISFKRMYGKLLPTPPLDKWTQPRSQGLSSSRPLEAGRGETLGTRLKWTMYGMLARRQVFPVWTLEI